MVPARRTHLTPAFPLIALSLLAPSLMRPDSVAAADAIDDAFLELALHHPAERDGDFDALAGVWLAGVATHSDDDRVDLLPRRLSTIVSSLARPDALLEPLEKLLANDRVRGPTRTTLASILSSEYERLGRRDDSLALIDGNGTLRHFLVIGPFDKARTGGLERRHPPEDRIDVSGGYIDGWQEIEWRPVTTRGPQLSMASHVWPKRGVMYALAQVRSDEARDALLHVESRSRHRIWLNAVAVIDDTGLHTFLSSHRQVAVRLEKGWNHLLVKTSTSLSLRLTGTDGTPFSADEVQSTTERVLHPIPDGAVGLSQVEVLGRAPERWRAGLESRETTERSDLARALDHLGLAHLWLDDARAELAVEEARRAAELAPTDPWVLHRQGRILQAASYLPTGQSKSRSKSAWEAAVAADPDFLPAQERLARSLQYDQKTDEALRLMNQALERRGDFLPGLLRLRRVYSIKDWKVDEQRVLDRIAAVAPDLAIVDIAKARYYADHNRPAKATEHYESAFEKDRRRTSLLSTLADLAAERGDLEAAERLLARRLALEPRSTPVAEQLAALLLRRGERERAEEAIRAHVATRSWDPDSHRALARILESSGDEEKARRAWSTVLELDPGDLELRRYLGSTGDDTGEFWTPYDETLEDWLPRVPRDGPLVERAAAICVLDIGVVEVRADGSSSEYIHQAFQLLTEKAKDSLASVRTPGEVIRLRTLTADGKTLEPVAALGKGSYVLPGVLPGAFTEHAYRVDRSGAHGADFRHGSFFFQDFRYQQSFLLSRMVFILPEDMPENLLETRITQDDDDTGRPPVDRTERRLEDGRRVVIYEARDVGRLQQERNMPAYQQYLPSVEIQPRRAWSEVEKTLRRFVEQATLTTPELAAAARRELAGTDDPLEKARRLHGFVTELVAKESGAGSAVRILLEKAGNRTILYKALLDEADVPSTWAFVREREALAQPVNWSHPSPNHFPWRFVRVEPPGHDPVWVTLRFRRLPFGHLPERFGGGRAFLLNERGAEIVSLPSVEGQVFATSMSGTMKLGTDESAEIAFRLRSGSLQSYLAKERMANVPTFQKNLILRGQATQMFPGAQVKSAGFEGLDDPESPMIISYELTAPKLLSRSGEDYLLAPVIQNAQLVRIFGGPPDRRHPYVLRQHRLQHDRFRVDVGEGLRIETLPQDVAVAGRLVSYSMSYRRDDDDLILERRLEILPGELEATEFRAHLDVLQAADAAESERVVLRAR